jgi:hypothetical protein
MKSLQPPRFAQDLYRDLRDRRLLPVALLLIAALVAVPVLLSSSSGTPASAPAPALTVAPGSSDAATQAAVLTQQLGVRDYTKRLERFKRQNPFHQQFTLPEATSSTLTEPTSSATSTTGGSATSTTTSTDGGSATATGSTATGSSSGSTTQPAPVPDTRTQTRVLTYRVDVKVGPTGQLEAQKDVRPMKFLPGKDTPVVVFLGATPDGKQALFLVSGDVTSATGDGACMPDPSTCSYLTLKRGQKESLAYSIDGLTYELKLGRITSDLVKKHHG